MLKADWTQPAMVLFANGKALENREFKFYRNVTRFEIDNERSYEQYWKPLEPHLKDVKTIYFSADGVYNKINLSSLFNQSTQEYLVDRFSFSLVSNLRELLQTNRSVSGVRSAALFGYPYFGKTSANNGANQRSALNDILNIEFQELPGTKAEIDKVGALLREQEWKVDQFMSTEASEEKIKQLKNVRILHIATHGFFVASLNANDPVVFSDDIRQAAYNPLLRSGLIFSRTEAKSGAGAEDGILTAYEAISLPLEQTEIVVLSACETGQGEVRNGEGVYGLQRAILLAGARHLFMSLWKVDDEATQELMVEFYKQWLQTKSLSQAYRNTQLALKAKYSMPYYWAGFVLLGI